MRTVEQNSVDAIYSADMQGIRVLQFDATWKEVSAYLWGRVNNTELKAKYADDLSVYEFGIVPLFAGDDEGFADVRWAAAPDWETRADVAFPDDQGEYAMPSIHDLSWITITTCSDTVVTMLKKQNGRWHVIVVADHCPTCQEYFGFEWPIYSE